jgi:hypothetical protein
MGRWCRVKCDCPNRKTVSGSGLASYSDYCKYIKKPRAAKTPEEWEEKVREMYECGHQDGCLLQFAPGGLLKISYALERAYKKQPDQFEIFRKIGQPDNYKDEHLALSKEQIILWQMEIEQLKNYLSSKEFMKFREREIFEKEMAESDFLYKNTGETLEDALSLCEAALKTRNPIEFLW